MFILHRGAYGIYRTVSKVWKAYIYNIYVTRSDKTGLIAA